MREILFRGKKLWDGEWVEGYYVHIAEGEGTYDREHHYIQTDYKGALGPRFEVVPETVGQFIGLLDKGGNKIFEGDILEESRAFGRIERIMIGFEYSSFGYHTIGAVDGYDPVDDCEYGINIFYYAVIGNIHDNPELLK